LTADANFGASFGLVAAYIKSASSNISSTGVIRLANLDTVSWRNAANNADLALRVNASDRLQFGGVDVPTVSSTDTMTNKTLTSPTMTAPVLGNVASGNLANCTGYATGSLTGLGANVSSFLGSPSSSSLAGAVADGTGTGAAVFGTSPTLTTPQVDAIVLDGQASAPSNPSAGFYKGYVSDSDGKFHILDSSGNDAAVGSGSSGRNYMGDWYDAAKDIGTVTNSLGDTLSSSDRTANKTTWGSSNTSLLTIARSTNSELRQTYNYLITEAGSSSGAFIEGPLFTLDQVDIGKPVSVSFDVKGNAADGDYQCYIVRYNASNILQSRIVVAGNASTTSPNSAKLPTGTTTFNGFFVPDSTTTTDQYAVRIVSNNSSAASIRIDTIFIGPQPIRVGAAITDWQSYTSTTQGLGTITSEQSWWRRNGSQLDVVARFTTGTTTASEARFGLPSGLTVGSPFATNTKLCGTWYRNSSTSTQVKNGLLLSFEGYSYVVFGFSDTLAAASPLSVQNGDNIIASSQAVTLSFSVPISQWTTNLTMADRAVEEYSSNSNTADASDSSSFVYGPAGSATPGALTGTQTKRVRFTTPIQPTDTLILEFMNSSVDTNLWLPASGNYWGTLAYQQQLSNAYGVYVRKVNATDADVFFSANAQTSSGVYGAAGTSWSSITNTRWRVRKVSGGAQVGYPISGQNLIGRTDGNAPASGYIGQRISATITSTLSIGTSETDVTGASLALTSGRWEIKYSVSVQVTSGASASNSSDGVVKITNSSNTLIGTSSRRARCKTVAAVAGDNISCLSAMEIVDISADTTYKLRALRNDDSGTGGFSVYNAANLESTFYAIRIA
jgi:hypothetical protein